MIHVEKLNISNQYANSYLIYNETIAIIIDPTIEVNLIKRYLQNQKLVAIFLTHGHYDHFVTLQQLLNTYSLKCYMHRNCYQKLLDANLNYSNMFKQNTVINISTDNVVFVGEGNRINLEDISIKSSYKPGHTDCSNIYYINNMMFSGDFLFKNSIGRCDLYTGNIEKMRQSLQEISRVKDNYLVYPGHDEITTLDEEKNNNYYLTRDFLQLKK